MKGAWLLPTRARPQNVARFFKAAVEMGMSTPGYVVASAVSDLPEMEFPDGWDVKMTKAEGMGDKFREIWPEIKDLDWIGWLVDDVIPMTPKWDTTLISGLNGANLISCNDGARAPLRMHCPVFSGDWLRALEYLYAPGFWHTYWDDALERLGRATDTWWVCMDVLLKHEDQFQTGNWDATGIASYSRQEQDKAALRKWRIEEMDRAVARIMTLKANKREPQRKVANA